MEHVSSPTYLDRQTIRVSAILPGAGAYDTVPLERFCSGLDKVTLFVSYTRGGAGGKMRMRIEVSPSSSGTDWYNLGLYAPATVASGSETISLIQGEAIEYGAVGAGAEGFSFGPIQLSGAMERIRIACAESGAIATPGVCSILAVFEEEGG